MSNTDETKGKFDIEQVRRDELLLKKYAAIKHSENDTVSVSRLYIDMVEDFEAALVLDELMFWTLPKSNGKTSLRVRRDGYLWLAVSRHEWWDRKRLSERQADRAIDKLIAKDLIVKDIFMFDGHPRTHLRVKVANFFALMNKFMMEKYKDDDTDLDEKAEISDLYEMMGIHQTDMSILPNGEMLESPNGEIINSPNPTNTPKRDIEQVIEEANKKVDVYLQLLNSPGIKREARIDSILSYIAGKLRINTETKRWKEFAKFVDNRQREYNEGVDVFVNWLTGQKNFDVQYWSPQRMTEMWPQAFAGGTQDMTRLL